jgi:hypothetical protein
MKYRARRRLTSFEVFLSTDDSRRRADILDVTERGARIRLDIRNLEPDTEVAVDIRGRSYPARVVWCKEGEAGIAFKGILPLDTFGAVNRSMRRAAPPKKKRFLMQ